MARYKIENKYVMYKDGGFCDYCCFREGLKSPFQNRTKHCEAMRYNPKYRTCFNAVDHFILGQPHGYYVIINNNEINMIEII